MELAEREKSRNLDTNINKLLLINWISTHSHPYVYLIITINWCYNLFHVRISRAGGLFLFYFWICFFSIILSIAQGVTGSIIHQGSHPSCSSFHCTLQQRIQPTNWKRPTEPGNEQSGQLPKEFSNKLDKIIYVNNLWQINLTTFQNFSEKKYIYPHTGSGTKILDHFSIIPCHACQR